jgi:Mg2+-importing ATPase
MDDDRLGRVVKNNNVFAKLNPEQKYRIIKLLKQQHNVVGYQGDGINDAPALKLADVAIAVNNATDVAQESADILLLRNDLGVIVNGIEYGRSIFININKYIRYTMIGNFGNFFALSALYLISSSSLPMLPIQLVLTGLLTDIPLVTIATDNVDPKDLLRPSVFDTHILMFISMFLGSITALFEILFFSIVHTQPSSKEQTSLFLFLTLSQLVIILSVRNKEHFWHAAKLSKNMVIAFAGVVIVTILMVYVGATKKLFSFGPVPLTTFGIIVGMTVFYLYVLDIIKVWFFQSRVGENHEAQL